MHSKLKFFISSSVSCLKIGKRELLVLLPLIFVLGLRITTLSGGGENSQDVYYHIALADMGHDIYMQKTFPYATLSLWQHQFSDKELGFHLLLSSFRSIKHWLGMPVSPPFNFEYMLFIMLFFVSFIATAAYFKIRDIFIYTFLLVSISPFFLMRIEMLRPHLLAITILVSSCMVFDRIRSMKDLWLAFILGAVMAWCYSNPHFILFTAVPFAFSKWKENMKLVFLIPLAAVLGIILGFIIHPQFPNTFVNWKVQCIDVVLTSFKSDSAVRVGGELRPADIHFIIEQTCLYLLMAVNIILFASSCIKRGFNQVPRHIISLFILSLFSVGGTFIAIRFAEYAVPFTLLSSGALISWSASEKLFSYKFSSVTVYRVMLLFSLCCMVYSWSNYRNRMKGKEVFPYIDFALFLRDSAFPTATIIGNINWSDFPLLLYAAPKYRYLSGVDPMFAYFANRDKMEKIELFRTGRKFVKPEDLYSIIGTRFMFVSKYNNQLSADLFKHGFISIYQGRDGNLFDLLLSYQNRVKRHKDMQKSSKK